jgi:aminopeptidase N
MNLERELPVLKDKLSLLITNPDVMRSSSDIIKLLQQISIQEDIYRLAGEKLSSSGNGKDAIQYGKEKKKLDVLNYELNQLITAKKAMARGGQAANELRDLYVKQVELNCGACEKARERLASLDASAAPAAAAAAAAPAASSGWSLFGRKKGGRKTRRRHTKRSKKSRQTRSRR